MTCIAAAIDPNGTVWMGGDSAGVSGYDLTVRADEKVFARGPYLIGFTASFRMGDILRFHARLPAPPTRCDLRRFMVTRFIEAVRASLNKYGFARKKDAQESGGRFLVGLRGRIFTIDSDYQVGEARHGFDAVGCGDMIALGSFHATRRRRNGRWRVLEALAAAEEFSAGVRSPFVVLGRTRSGKAVRGKDGPS